MTVDLELDTLPETFFAAVRAAMESSPDIEEQKRSVVANVRGLDEFDAIAGLLIDRAAVEALYRLRCEVNQEIKRNNGEYGAGAKVPYATAAAVTEVFRSLYDKFIAGRRLGDMLGEELRPVADQERAVAKGHEQNARLLDKLAPLVKEGKRVRDCVTDKKLREIWRAVNGSGSNGNGHHKTNGTPTTKTRPQATVASR